MHAVSRESRPRRRRVLSAAVVVATVVLLATVFVVRPFSSTAANPSAVTVAPADGPTAPVAAQSPAQPAGQTPAAQTPAAQTPASAHPATGALFDGPADDPGDHFCSASVVDSTAGNMIMTAAHCVSDGDGSPARTGMTFAPGFQDGVAPYGYWTVTSAAAGPGWLADGDPDDDVAFLTVDQPGSAPVQQVTGSYRVDFGDGPADVAVTAVGYNSDEQSPTVVSGTATPWSPTQLRLDEPGLDDGTSGGPLLTGPDGTEIVGVIGGFELGGDTPLVSYAAALEAPIEALYAAAGGD